LHKYERTQELMPNPATQGKNWSGTIESIS
jgi:hypothetical protein